jgi:hypothetical protein
MRFAVAILLISRAAHADIKVVEEAGLGTDLAPEHPLLSADFKACTGDASGGPLFWVEVSKTGKVSSAHVHGAGKLDACLEKALGKAKVTAKLASPAIVAGHLEVEGQDAPRISQAPVVLDAHHAKWQVTANAIHYTANRALDIANALDGASSAISDCAGKRDAGTHALIWYDGKTAVVRSAAKAYDDCVAKALTTIKLPAAESAFWIQADVAPPGEQLAPHVDDPHLSHEQALRDAVSTAVRSHKLDIDDCLQGHPKSTVSGVTVTLYGEKLTTKQVATADGEVSACVKKKLDGLKIPNALPTEQLELEVEIN